MLISPDVKCLCLIIVFPYEQFKYFIFRFKNGSFETIFYDMIFIKTFYMEISHFKLSKLIHVFDLKGRFRFGSHSSLEISVYLVFFSFF